MPEISAIHIVLLVLLAVAAAAIGWLLRGQRAARQKVAINAGWQEQIDANRGELQRLTDQNKDLMGQISHLQAANQDAKARATELSAAVDDARSRRDALRREIKDVRGNLETVMSARDRLQSNMAGHNETWDIAKQKDDRILQLGRELDNWHKRLPPLIERYRSRDREAKQLEAELAKARRRIKQLENAHTGNATRIEPIGDPDSLTDGRGASNDPSSNQPDRPLETIDASGSGESITPRDDLQQIKGVGPAIERTLNELGFFHLQQIANMNEYEIDRVAQRLRGFKSRIYRENWIGQARELCGRDSAV